MADLDKVVNDLPGRETRRAHTGGGRLAIYSAREGPGAEDVVLVEVYSNGAVRVIDRSAAIGSEYTGASVIGRRGTPRSSQLRARHGGPTPCGILANLAGLIPVARPCTPAALVDAFAWSRVRREDLVFA